MLLSKDAILQKAQQFKYEDIDVPEWDGSVRIRMLSAAARNAFLGTVLEMDGAKVKSIKVDIMQTTLLSYALVDESGAPMFSRDEIGQMDAEIVLRLFTIAQRLNGLDEEAVATAAENFTATQNGDSISD